MSVGNLKLEELASKSLTVDIDHIEPCGWMQMHVCKLHQTPRFAT